MKLIIGNKNYSSWSLRAWLAARAFFTSCNCHQPNAIATTKMPSSNQIAMGTP